MNTCNIHQHFCFLPQGGCPTRISQTRQKERSTITCTPSHHDRLFYLFDDVFALVGLAGGEGQLEVILSGVW